ncbi:protein FAF-like, chloroplastic [Corylus avellana]|uniref:protein FAF-like, chloroplastic n=1 Tax=Corylus avellana TaxID=13451 RepID=UPI00286B4885|nr:protein FAF-like, chloroplastic [Corylus avellana]
MSTSLSKSLRFSSFPNVEEEAKVVEKQGIVTILGSDCERTKAASLRRTLSADMSSKKWLAQNGFSLMKKIASSERISVSLADSSSSSEGEEDEEERKEKMEGREQFDMWSSILSQKANDDASNIPLPPPYIHPLVKRSTSSLSEKSLQICTESLGSETGSDGFSSYPPSETGEAEEEEEEEEEQQQLQEDLKAFDSAEELRVAKYNKSSAFCKKSQAKSFPPPLPSLSREDGASLRMQSRRDNGRLVLEAVSIPSQNRFRAQRQDGRLVLTFVDSILPNEAEKDEEEEEDEEEEMEDFEEELGDFEEVYDDDDDDDGGEEEEEEDEEIGMVIEQAPISRVINVHRLALMMNKPIGIAGRNPTWPRRFNEVVKFEDDDEEEEVTKSLPPRPRVARLMPSNPAAPPTAAASFNAYEYYWRAKPAAQQPPQPTAAAKNNPNNLIISSSRNINIPAANDQQQSLVLMRGGCKEPRRSLLFWEPYCIATS